MLSRGLVGGAVALGLGLAAYRLYASRQGLQVHIVDSAERLRALCDSLVEALDRLEPAAEPVVGGLDTEWAAKEEVAVLQLAVLDLVLLIRPKHLLANGDSLCEVLSLRQLLMHPKVSLPSADWSVC